MTWTQIIGTTGETRVREWLAKKGFQLVIVSWNCPYGEVDIIASFFDQLHFIAVATKRATTQGLPAEGVTRKKMLSCKQAAQKYLEHYPRWKNIIFDVLAIEADEEGIVLIKDVGGSISN